MRKCNYTAQFFNTFPVLKSRVHHQTHFPNQAPKANAFLNEMKYIQNVGFQYQTINNTINPSLGLLFHQEHNFPLPEMADN